MCGSFEDILFMICSWKQITFTMPLALILWEHFYKQVLSCNPLMLEIDVTLLFIRCETTVYRHNRTNMWRLTCELNYGGGSSRLLKWIAWRGTGLHPLAAADCVLRWPWTYPQHKRSCSLLVHTPWLSQGTRQSRTTHTRWSDLCVLAPSLFVSAQRTPPVREKCNTNDALYITENSLWRNRAGN